MEHLKSAIIRIVQEIKKDGQYPVNFGLCSLAGDLLYFKELNNLQYITFMDFIFSYQEKNGLETEDYIFKKGDWLSRLNLLEKTLEEIEKLEKFLQENEKSIDDFIGEHNNLPF